MNLTVEDLEQKWQALTEFIETTFKDERKEKLMEIYTYFQDRMLLAPASAKEHYHNTFPGGYISHVLHVIECATKLFNLWKDMEAHINYDFEELMFVALNHDLGKIGDIDNEYYIPNPSEWHRLNMGEIYAFNPKLTYMEVPHRSIFLLQSFGIKMTQNEMLGILLHDGLYDEGNKPYFISYKDQNKLRTNLPLIMHQADLMASQIEYEKWKYLEGSTQVSQESKKQLGKKKSKLLEKLSDTTVVKPKVNAKSMFNEIFGDTK